MDRSEMERLRSTLQGLRTELNEKLGIIDFSNGFEPSDYPPEMRLKTAYRYLEWLSSQKGTVLRLTFEDFDSGIKAMVSESQRAFMDKWNAGKKAFIETSQYNKPKRKSITKKSTTQIEHEESPEERLVRIGDLISKDFSSPPAYPMRDDNP